MFDYPYKTERDGDGWRIWFPDIPGVNTDADTEEEIPQRAHDALVTMLAEFVRTRCELPAPTYDQNLRRVNVGRIVDFKLMLHQGMVWNRITQAQLAQRLGTSPQLVSRLLNLDHTSRLEQLEAAMDAINVRPVIKFDPQSNMPPRARRVDAGFLFPVLPRATASTSRTSGARKR
jgi:antitoxin HicB